MKPCDCKDEVDAKSMTEHGIGINDWSLSVTPVTVGIEHRHYGKIKIPMTIFTKFAEWYLEDQNDESEPVMKYEKFCEQQGLSKEAIEEGVYNCNAHLAEARCMACPYDSPAARLLSKYPCSDFELKKRKLGKK